MRPKLRLLAKAALTAALAALLLPAAAAHAEDGDVPPISFDTSDDFSSLRGTDPTEPVELAPQPGIGQQGLALDQVDDAADGSRIKPVAPVTGKEDDEDQRARSRTADARDETAYDPLGIRLGSFILLPAVELSTGFTSNAAQSSTGGPSGLFNVAPDIVLRSDWSQHELGFRLKGSYDYYTDGSAAPDPNLYVEGNGRIDLPDDWKLRLKGDYTYDTQSIDELGFPLGVTDPPGVNTFDAGATLDGTEGRVVLQLRGTATYTGYENAFAGDVEIDQSYRDNTLLSAAARVGYQWTPTVAPFVEAQYYGRLFTDPTDPAGFSRNSDGFALRGGVTYSADPILKGEIALGWRHQDYVDSTFQPFDVPTVDASLVWSPSVLTQVALVAATYVDTANDPGASSTVVYDIGLTATRYIRRNFTLEGDLGWRHEHYMGTDLNDITYEAGLTGTWKINREAWVVGRLAQEYYVSATPGGDYPTTTATIGLRFQR